MSKLDEINSIITKRGFFFPSAEIYGSKSGFWTYGHLGLLMKQRFENLWRNYFLSLNENYFEISDSNILPEKVFEGSGHLKHFNDPLTECKKCHFRFRADELIEDELSINVGSLNEKEMTKIIKEKKLKCPKCGNELEDVKWFNMMFDVKVGSTGNERMYLRPETAQSAYLSFKREFFALREKLPFGLAVIGKAFRNEISPRQGFFRLREFTQAELQIFFDVDEIDNVADWNKIKNYKIKLYIQNKDVIIKCDEVYKKLKLPRLYVYNLAKIQQFYLDILKIPIEKFRLRELSEKERAFYNKIHFDIEINLDTLNGFKEISGLHYRTNYDLSAHQKNSGENLEVTINGKKILPHVLELSFGVDRNIWALLDVFYTIEKERTLFKFPPGIAPFDTAIFPLVSNKKNVVKYAKKVYELIKDDFKTFYDESGSIGRRYRRMDEIGCPCQITIDFDSLKKNDVTLRDRNSMKQIRVKVSKLKESIKEFLSGKSIGKLGKLIN